MDFQSSTVKKDSGNCPKGIWHMEKHLFKKIY